MLYATLCMPNAPSTSAVSRGVVPGALASDPWCDHLRVGKDNLMAIEAYGLAQIILIEARRVEHTVYIDLAAMLAGRLERAGLPSSAR